jgi:hypothetical protein
LHQDIEDGTVLIDGAPQIVLFAVDAENDFIEVPRITRSGAAVPSLVRVCLPERPAPVAHCFIGEDHAACRHELFDIAVAEAEAKIQPHAVTDDLGREAMAFIRVD